MKRPPVNLTFLLLAPELLLGQILPFKNYTMQDGLASNCVNVIYQDSRGYLWIGTIDGLSVFDGRTFTTYTTAQGLTHNYVKDILEDRSSPGTMWIATIAGLNSFEKGLLTRFPQPQSKLFARCLLQDHAGKIWCAIENSVYQIHNDTFKLARDDTTFATHQMVESGNGLLWSHQGFRLQAFWPRTGKSKTLLREDGLGRIWLGTPVGAVCVESLDPLVLRQPHELYGFGISACGKLSDGLLWFSVTGGLRIFDPRPKTQDHVAPLINLTGFRANGKTYALATAICACRTIKTTASSISSAPAFWRKNK